MSHARLAPSKSERVLLCAASPDREASLPDDDSSASANEGSNAHWLLEQGLAEAAWPPAIVAFGPEKLKAALPYPDFDLPDPLIEQAKQCYEYATKRATELGAELQAEGKVNPEMYTGRSDSYGSVDVSLVSATFLEIIDLKTGGVQVDADASQLKLYALGKMAQYADPLSGLTPFTSVRLTVFQPKRPGMDTIERFQDFTQQELIDWAADVWIPAAKASDNPAARATPTEAGCKYCKCAKHSTCPEYTAAMQGAAATLFSPVEGQAVTVVDPLESAFSVEGMSVEQVSAFLEIWPLMKARGKDIEEHAVALLKARTPIPGFKLVKGQGSRKWALGDEEQAKKFKNMKLTLKQVFVQKLRSPSQMLSSDISTKQKDAVKKHVTHKDGALTVVPVSDKRVDAMPAVKFNPVESEAPAPAATLDFLSL